MDEQFFTLADLERITDAKRRAIQLWAEAGALKVEGDSAHGGRGAHRLFSRTEAIIACLLRGFSKSKMAIGELVDIADAVRRLMNENSDAREDIEGVMISDQPVYLVFTRVGVGSGAWRADILLLDADEQTAKEQLWEIEQENMRLLRLPESMTHKIMVNTYLKDF